MKLEGKIRKKVIGLVKRLVQYRMKHPYGTAFKDNAFYVTLGDYLIDVRPHYGWKKAYKAAKRQHSKAFIIRGDKLNKRFAPMPHKPIPLESLI